MEKAFDLRLLDQYWVNGSRDTNFTDDPTSHGKIALIVNGEDISGCDDGHTDYGINQAAPRLLQTVVLDHAPDPEDVSDTAIFPHGCWILSSCPNCVIDFSVSHLKSDEVILSQFVVTGAGVRRSLRLSSRAVRLPLTEYAQMVLTFAEQALSFLPPRAGADEEAEYYELLRAMHVKLIALVRKYLVKGKVTRAMRREAQSYPVFTLYDIGPWAALRKPSGLRRLSDRIVGLRKRCLGR